MPHTLQRRLRDATRRAVFADPALAEEYGWRHKRRPLLWAVTFIGAVLVIGGVGTFLGAALFYLPLQEVSPRGPLAQRGMQPIFLGLVQAMVCLFAMQRAGLYVPPEQMRTGALFPADDNSIRQVVRSGFKAYAAMFAVFGAMFSGLAFAGETGPWGPRLAWYGALVLLGVHGAGCALLMAAYWPAWGSLRTLTMLAIASVVAGFCASFGFLAVENQPLVQYAILLAAYATPLGWPLGAFDYAVLQGQAWGWLFLVPVAGVLLVTWRWFHRPVIVREFRVTSQGQYYPEFESGFVNALTLQELQQGPKQQATAPANPVEFAVTVVAVRKKIISGTWREAKFWHSGPVERFAGAWLTVDERQALRPLLPGPWQWTTNAVIISLLTLGVAALLGAPRIFGGPFVPASMLLLPSVMFVALFEVIAGTRSNVPPLLHVHYPHDYRAASPAIIKGALLRLAALAPAFCISVALVHGWNRSLMELLFNLSFGVVAMLLGMMALLKATCVLGSSRRELSWIMFLDWLALFVLLVVPSMGVAISLGPESIVPPLAAQLLLLVGATLELRYLRWRFERTELDFLDPSQLTQR